MMLMIITINLRYKTYQILGTSNSYLQIVCIFFHVRENDGENPKTVFRRSALAAEMDRARLSLKIRCSRKGRR